MSWQAVLCLDLRRAGRSRFLVGVAATYLVAVLLLAVGLAIAGEELTVIGAIMHLISLMEWLIPAIGLAVGWGAVVGERDRRTLPHLILNTSDRRHVLLGKFLSRTLIVATAILLGTVVLAGVYFLVYPAFGQFIVPFVLFSVVTVAFAVAMVGLGLGLSAVTRHPVRAAAGAMGLFVLFVFLWDLVPAGVYYLSAGSLPGSGVPPAWYYVLLWLNPIEAYVELLTAVFPFLDSNGFAGPSGSVLAMAGVLCGWLGFALGIGGYRLCSIDL